MMVTAEMSGVLVYTLAFVSAVGSAALLVALLLADRKDATMVEQLRDLAPREPHPPVVVQVVDERPCYVQGHHEHMMDLPRQVVSATLDAQSS